MEKSSGLVSDEEIKKIAEELGIKIRVDAENAGVLNTTTGELRSLSSYFDEIFPKNENERGELENENIRHQINHMD